MDKEGVQVFFGVPNDQKLLAALGSLSIRHGHLDHVLKMTIKTLAGVSIKEALDANKRLGSAELRKRILVLAKDKFGEGTTLIKIESLIENAKKATEKRNDLIHRLWGQDANGTPYLKTDDHEWEKLPTVNDLNRIEADIIKITNEINRERLEGFIFQALNKKKPALQKQSQKKTKP